MKKLTDKHFIDWESHVFGFGYGTGEEYTLIALKTFFANCTEGKNCSYETLEKVLTPTVAWLMINILCHADVIEYGTSPRYGWLNEKGQLLKRFVDKKTINELYKLISQDSDYIYCYPDYCNCDGEKCNNPLFKS